jgi:hypothetical protein
MSDGIVKRLNTEEMTKEFYKAFPTVVTLEDAMRQALEAADEIERLRADVMYWKALPYCSECGCGTCQDNEQVFNNE